MARLINFQIIQNTTYCQSEVSPSDREKWLQTAYQFTWLQDRKLAFMPSKPSAFKFCWDLIVAMTNGYGIEQRETMGFSNKPKIVSAMYICFFDKTDFRICYNNLIIIVLLSFCDQNCTRLEKILLVLKFRYVSFTRNWEKFKHFEYSRLFVTLFF